LRFAPTLLLGAASPVVAEVSLSVGEALLTFCSSSSV
jgi:hypothetical protein